MPDLALRSIFSVGCAMRAKLGPTPKSAVGLTSFLLLPPGHANVKHCNCWLAMFLRSVSNERSFMQVSGYQVWTSRRLLLMSGSEYASLPTCLCFRL